LTLVEDPEQYVPVSVPLTPTGAATLGTGTTVQADFVPDNPDLEEPSGYRAFMRAG
jgi:hypothetical protein